MYHPKYFENDLAFSKCNKENINFENLSQPLQKKSIAVDSQYGSVVVPNPGEVCLYHHGTEVLKDISNKPNFIDKIKKKFAENTIKAKVFLRKDRQSGLDAKPEKTQQQTTSHSSTSTSVNHAQESSSFYQNENSEETTFPEISTPLFVKYSKLIPHEYLPEIWENLKFEENAVNLCGSFMDRQIDINAKMRAILVDWLVEVHFRFRLTADTLFITVNLIDSYIAKRTILRSKFQLVGVATLFIACKYEEIMCPDIQDFVYVTNKTYSKKEIFSQEKEILSALDFQVLSPTSLNFFEIVSLNFNFDALEHTYGRYLLDLFLIEANMRSYQPSLVALASAYLIMKQNHYSNYKDLYLLINSGSREKGVAALKACAKEIYNIVVNVDKLNYKSAFKKYSTREFYCVSVVGMTGY